MTLRTYGQPPPATRRPATVPTVRSFQFGTLDPSPVRWTGAAPPTVTVKPVSDADSLALRVEAEGIWHRLESDRLNRARADALEAQVIETCGGLVAYHHATERAARADRSGVNLPDPSRSAAVARVQGRTLRVPKGTSPERAAELRADQLRRRLDSGLTASITAHRSWQSYHDWAVGRRRGDPHGCSCDCHTGRR